MSFLSFLQALSRFGLGKVKGGPIARNSLGTLSAISQAILVGMLSFFHRVYIGTSSFDENTV